MNCGSWNSASALLLQRLTASFQQGPVNWGVKLGVMQHIYDVFLICTPIAKQLVVRSQSEKSYYQAQQFPSDMSRHVLRPDYIVPFSHNALHSLARHEVPATSAMHVGHEWKPVGTGLHQKHLVAGGFFRKINNGPEWTTHSLRRSRKADCKRDAFQAGLWAPSAPVFLRT